MPFEPAPRPSNELPGVFTGSVLLSGGPCTPCLHAEDCRGDDNLCVQNGQTRDRFCAFACGDRQGCPNGYRCVDVENANVLQCVPETDDCSHVMSPLAPSLSVVRAEALRQLNELRTEFDVPPFAASDCLDRLAQDSAFELSQTGDVGGKFERECEQTQPDPCECNWSAQAERRMIEFGLTWEEAFDRFIDRGTDPDDPLSRYVSWPEHVYVGIGIVLSGDAVWMSISFGQ